jgi:uroporphyrinogen decarboxylase
LSCLVLSCLVLSCLVLSCLVLSCLVLSCLALPLLALLCLAVPYLELPCLALPCPALSIGFSAAPWTLFFYMVGGSSKQRQDVGEKWLLEHTEAAEELLDRLTPVVIEYLSAQVEAGAHMLQVFEAMGMMLSRPSFEKFALPRLKEMAVTLKRRHPTVPLLVFPRGASYSLGDLQEAGYDVVTMDTEMDAKQARQHLDALYDQFDAGMKSERDGRGGACTLQGNLDAAVLRPHEGGDEIKVREAVTKLLESAGPQRLIANLGEGLMGNEDPALVSALVDAIHSISEKMIKNIE